jgi:hypothetical protein
MSLFRLSGHHFLENGLLAFRHVGCVWGARTGRFCAHGANNLRKCVCANVVNGAIILVLFIGAQISSFVNLIAPFAAPAALAFVRLEMNFLANHTCVAMN